MKCFKHRRLYRKVNTTAHGVHHATGGDARDERRGEAPGTSMHGRKKRGLDYTPLFRFLLSKVGAAWSEVLREASARLDQNEPIYWLVALRPEDERAYVLVGESTYFSGLRVDEAGVLRRVDPKLGPESLAPRCACCTHTFNGVKFTRAFETHEESERA